MTNTNIAGPGVDQIYQCGPETLVAESSAVASGKVIKYSRVVTSMTGGVEQIPITWTVSGQIEHPVAIKGLVAPAPISFSRDERSPLAQRDPTLPAWLLDYGNVAPEQVAVLFLAGPEEKAPVTVVPGGEDSRALIALLRDIVRIQELSTPDEQSAAWQDSLRGARTSEMIEVALRSLVRLRVSWASLYPILERIMNDSKLDFRARSFVFGIVTFAITHDVFAVQQSNSVQFLCDTFLAEGNPRLSLQYVLNLKLLLRYTAQSDGRQRRMPMERQIIRALKLRASQGPLSPEVLEQYREIQQTHPELRG
ncbi:MAG TPA: hypothetical protein VN643_18535 [Pyrinomonadaceae bacterium]|nr:hypothetical protein [Pyrinomonadaceae bacterium]